MLWKNTMKYKLLYSIYLFTFMIFSYSVFCETIVERVYINDDSLNVFDIEIDNYGDVYVSQYPQGVLKNSHNQWIQLHSNPTLDISFSTKGALWIREKGYFGKYLEGIWTYYEYDYSLHPAALINIPQEDIVWAITSNSGLRRFDFNTNTITIYDTSDGLSSSWSRIIETTSDGHVWVSHTSIGFCESCTYKGVSHFDGKKWEIFTVENGLPDKEIRAIVAYSAEEVYIGSWKGIVKYNGETLEPFADCRADIMAKGYDGALWVATWENYNSPERHQIYLKYHKDKIEKYERNDAYYPSKIVIDNNDNVWTLFGSDLYKTVIYQPAPINTSPPKQPISVSIFPNPFNSITSISFYLPLNAVVQLNVYNINGQRIDTLIDERLSAGKHTVYWDISQHASGLYFCRLCAGNLITTTKMCLIR